MIPVPLVWFLIPKQRRRRIGAICGATILEKGHEVAVPEIADYEVRRELVRANKREGIQRLDLLKSSVFYLPITTRAILKATEFWAHARNTGQQTADDKALDGDVILAAQAFILAEDGEDVVVATTNAIHLSLFVNAFLWYEIE